MTSTKEHFSTFCADIGSVKAKRFGWFGIDADDSTESGESIEDLAQAVAGRLSQGHKVALGFECPLFVPFRQDPQNISNARLGEGNRSWSAGAGCGALTIGLVEVAWILREIRKKLLRKADAFVSWNGFAEAENGLFLWEAFVSGNAKGGGHIQDAEIAVRRFLASMPNPEAQNAIREDEVFSLVGACLIRTGWTTDLSLLCKSCIVIKV